MRIDRCPSCHRRIIRSNEQNRLYWALLHLLSDKVKVKEQSYSSETWHLYCKSRFLGCEDHVLPGGKILTLPRSTANLDVSEFGEYLDKVQTWAAERDVYLADIEGTA